MRELVFYQTKKGIDKMKCTFLLILIIFSYSEIGIAQNKIEILVNGLVQNFNQTISVSNYYDVIEVRIYPISNQKTESLIDSLKSEGCGLKTIRKKRTVFIESRDQQQVQQSSTRPVQKKYDAISFKKPVFKSSYYSFEFNVEEVTGCKGKYFYLSLIFDSNKSMLKTFEGYLSKYKFIYVL